MRKLLVALCLLPSITFAENPLYGCYHSNGDPACTIATITCADSGDWGHENVQAFGYTVGAVCNGYALYYLDDLKNIAKVKAANTLIAKLRKACGTKCKKIK